MKLTGNKKYMVIGGIVLAVIAIAYYLLKGSNTTNTLNASGISGGTGSQPNAIKEGWEVEDEDIYKAMRADPTVKPHLSWIDPIAKERYQRPVSALNEIETLNGNRLMSGVFYQTLSSVAPNSSGRYPPLHWEPGKKSLIPATFFDHYWTKISELKSKHFKL